MTERQTGRLLESPIRRILDTVVLVAFVEPKHLLHQVGKKYIEALTTEPDVFLPSTSLIELDLVFKSEELNFRQRKEIFGLLSQVIPDQKILPLTSPVMETAILLDNQAKWTSHYFDVIIAAYALHYSAKILTTDKMIPALGVNVEW